MTPENTAFIALIVALLVMPDVYAWLSTPRIWAVKTITNCCKDKK